MSPSFSFAHVACALFEGGSNQLFQPRLKVRGVSAYCTPSNSICVAQHDVLLKLEEKGLMSRPCRQDTFRLGLSCASWVDVGECNLSNQYMREHCESSCAREHYFDCRLDDDNSTDLSGGN